MENLSNEDCLIIVAALTSLISTSLKYLYSCQPILTSLINEHKKKQTTFRNLIAKGIKLFDDI